MKTRNLSAIRSANLEALYKHGWPRNADNRRTFALKQYGGRRKRAYSFRADFLQGLVGIDE